MRAPREIPAEARSALNLCKAEFESFDARAWKRDAQIQKAFAFPEREHLAATMGLLAVRSEAQRLMKRVTTSVNAFRRGAVWADERRLIADATWARYFLSGALIDVSEDAKVIPIRPGVH